MTMQFNRSKDPTIGVEVEMQIVDLKTLNLASKIHEFLDRISEPMRLRIKPEFLQSTLEINTEICHTVKQVGEDLSERLETVFGIADDLGLGLICSGTHPISSWKDQEVTADPRYLRLMDDFQILGRRLAICGFHVHIGVDSGNKAVSILNILRGYLPHLLAISTSSPFWAGYRSGMYSTRIKVFEVLPTAGLPPRMKNWDEFVALVDTLTATKTIESTREIWWEARPHPAFGTVETRVCDSPSTLEDMLIITALIQALVVQLCRLYETNELPDIPLRQLVEENKWQAARHGLEGRFIDYYSARTVSIRNAVRNLVEFLRDTARSLGTLSYIERVEDILVRGTSAHQQLQVYDKTGSLEEVIHHLMGKIKP